ncbi:MAG: response regulator [Desulfobacterales bacterium]|nr:response regulator [Desulfobacterales bacterium]
MALLENKEKHILIIDDKIENLKVLSMMLHEQNFTVREAINGSIALKSIQKVKPDLILLDILLPDMNGYDLCKQLKSNIETKNIPVLFISVLDETKDKIKAFDAGGVDYLRKPFEEQEVIARINTHLKISELQKRLEQEIEANKKTEKYLYEEKKKAQKYLDIACVMLVALNSKGEIILINKKGCKIIGYKEEDILRKNWFETIIPKKIKEDMLNVFHKLMAGDVESFEYFENSILTKDNQERILQFHNTVIKNELGYITGILFSGEDITEQRIAQEEKNKIEEQLRQSQKIEAIGTLAGGIAHDFNNMLGVIIGNTSYALSRLNRDDELFEILSDVHESAKRSQKLTRQLLTFAKGGDPIKKTVNIKEFIKESVNFVTIGTKIICEFDFKDDLWTVEIDVDQLNQAISHLLLNASHAMSEGGIIQIRSENTIIENDRIIPLLPGRYVKISIQDHGLGISEQYLSKIFEPYFSTKQKNSGLGLATTYSIIKKHNGHITVDSKIGEGTIFCIYLPASKRADIKKSEKKEASQDKGHGKILIMDDEESILRMVSRMLNSLGYEPYFSHDGDETIKIYQESLESEKPFDLLILDLTIPGGKGGAETIKRLLDINPNVKAVVSSGYSNDPVMANFKNYGFCEVLPKPYTRNQLMDLLRKF